LRCKYCGRQIKEGMKACPGCKRPLTHDDFKKKAGKIKPRHIMARLGVVLLFALITFAIVLFISMRVYYKNENQRITEQYVSQTVETITLDNGMKGHALTFFGTDGDSVYITELKKSYMFVGGVARVEFADCIWFEDEPEETDAMEVTFSPIYISSAGKKTRIPVFVVNINKPESPVTIKTPSSSHLNVITSQTGLDMQVVYGSQVVINGEDVTDKVDRSGNLSLTLNIYPIGDNNVSIVVRTDNHTEARRDLVFYREKMDIEVEIATSVGNTSTLSYMTVSGKTEPGAMIVVDSDYDRSSLVIDQATGKFSFKATFSTYGRNLVSFRATMEGRKDSSLSFYVSYLPAKAEYTRNAWKMDYAQLRLYYEQWNGRVFLCMGKIVDSFIQDGTRLAVMNVGNDSDVKLVVLENQSDIGRFNVGEEYAVYADVSGRLFYSDNYYPYLIARYSRD